jgi:hypothetical protein
MSNVIIASAAREGSKRAAAEAIFKDMTLTKKGLPRKNAPAPAEVKARFVSEVGMTMRQAATYYHMIASGKWAR